MDGLIKAIKNARETEKKVEYYFTMSVDEKNELLSDLAREKDEDIGIFLNAVYPDEPDKNIRKLIRKMIFRLRSSGVKVDEPGEEGKAPCARSKRSVTTGDISQTSIMPNHA